MSYTKNEIRAMLEQYLNLSAQSNALLGMIESALLQSNPLNKYSVKAILSNLRRGLSSDPDEIIDFLSSRGAFLKMEDGDEVKNPSLELSFGGKCVLVKQSVDGGMLCASIMPSECATSQAGIHYTSPDGILTDFALSEVKRGELAESSGYPADNKNVDLYIWGDPYNEDYTEKLSFSYESLVKHED